VARAAVAEVLATADGHHGVIYQATGPESLGAQERAALLSKAAGKPLAFVQVAPEQLREGLRGAGLPPDIVDAVISIKDMWAAGGFDVARRCRKACRPQTSFVGRVRGRGVQKRMSRMERTQES
jgi:uncharacterized protein YbjT (DUF2867 family)